MSNEKLKDSNKIVRKREEPIVNKKGEYHNTQDAQTTADDLAKRLAIEAILGITPTSSEDSQSPKV